ncbi:MAG: biotin carboxylase N-terminal domain-containing protein [Pseudomonadota bacterium]
MMKRLLVANRGEIACRIFETARSRGITTIAVFSDADARAKHVREADIAVRIGPAPATESYLRGDLIIEAAKAHGADAIHPGYGFLSENAEFAKAVSDAGLTWVGPSADTIDKMGLKDEAKRIAEEAGVPVLPGYRGEDQSLETLKNAANEIGYPLLIKAIAGGGGRGIRDVQGPDGFADQLESAVREAEAAFSDGRVMLEKLVLQPRHIEVQVFGDGKGNAVHFFERDCSLQRRRQKVVEEAPAPNMPEAVRAAMTGAAVKLAKAVDYAGAGTVEFIVDGTGPLTTESFWFLEMNTRLQVEHPVTEMITGQDLVAWQLDIADGEGLACGQDDIELIGHAIEARICAEDPADNYRPSAGLIEEFGLMGEADGETVRWDAGFETGDRVPAHYDSMVAKLIVWAENREKATGLLEDTLSFTQLVGVSSNIGFLRRCVMSDMFASGNHHVNWIGEQGEALTVPPGSHELASVLAVCDLQLEDTGGPDPWDRKDGWRLNSAARQKAPVAIADDADVLDPDDYDVPEETPLPLVTDLSPRRFAVTTGGDSRLVVIPDFDAAAEALAGGNQVSAPMPGKLVKTMIADGDEVEADQPVAVMEAMKMEHTLVAPRAGKVASVQASAGDQLDEGQIILVLEDED